MAFRWGIIGLGSIARKFAEGLKSVPGAELAAVGSRSQEKADKFGEEFGATRRHGSYEALAADPDVDAVYVASPHPMHKEHALLCLNGGKAVLCEKPFTINAAEAAAGHPDRPCQKSVPDGSHVDALHSAHGQSP